MTALEELLAVIDIQTTIFLIGIAVMIQGGLIWFQSLMIREYRGIRTAALGSFIYGLGMLLTSLRGIASDAVSIVVANYLVALGTVILYVAVCRFLNQKFSTVVIVVSLIPVLTLFPYFTFQRNDFTARVLLIGFSAAILLGAMSFKLFRLKHINYRFSANFLASVSAMYSVVLLLRNAGFWFFPLDGLFSQSLPATLNSLSLFASSFLWSIGFVMMVSHRLQEDLHELATVDSLTRISNRRAMVAQLEAEFSRYARTNLEFSILLVDVDHFKTVNDRYGHEMGDAVLRDVAQLLKNSLRRQDVISRWGGEEFLILLPNTSMSDAMEIGERLRTLVECSLFHCNGHHLSLTVSIGVGSSLSCGDVDRIYKSSDVALYKAKVTRNAVALNNMDAV